MNSRFLAAVILGGVCVAAAGGGAYLAVRQNAQASVGTAQPEAATSATPATVPEATASAGTAALAPTSTAGDVPRVETTVLPAPKPAAALTPATRAPAAPARERSSAVASAPAATTPAGPAAAQAVDPSPLVEPQAPEAPAPSPYIPSRPSIDPAPAEQVAQAEALTSGRTFEEVQVPADAVIGVQIDRTISSEFARVEDRVDGRITRDVRVAGQVAVPAGARVRGSVTFADQGGKFKARARLGVRFHTILLADGSSIPIQTETVFREGASPAGEARAKIGGGAVGGAIIGAILGGRKGAAVGGSLGAGAGTAAVAASDNNPATLPSGATITVRLSRPATVTIEKH